MRDRAICLLREEYPVLADRGRWGSATRDVGYVLGEHRAAERLRRHVGGRVAELGAGKPTEEVVGGLTEYLVLDPLEGRVHRFFLTVFFEMPD